MRIITYVIIAITGVALALPACKTTGLTKTQQISQFKKMSWLEGNWQNISPELSLLENWVKVNDTLYKAKSVLIMASDTLFSEEIKLAPSVKNIYFSVKSHSSDKTTNSSYVLMKNNGNTLVFEDPANKEQSRITYLRKSADCIILKVDGIDGKEVTTESYKLMRMK
jgi:hypothetical protein